MIRLKACKKCRGDLGPTQDGWGCIQCGNIIYRDKPMPLTSEHKAPTSQGVGCDILFDCFTCFLKKCIEDMTVKQRNEVKYFVKKYIDIERYKELVEVGK